MKHPRRTHRISLYIVLIAAGTTWAPTSAQEISSDEYRERRARVMRDLDDGVLLLHARSAEMAMAQWGFLQDASFLYFSGLPELRGAILALDGPGQESHLFIPPASLSFGVEVEIVGVEATAQSAMELGLTSIRPWEQFQPWMTSRLEEASTRVYLDGPRNPEATGAPPGLRPVAGDHALWRAAVEEAFPDAEVVSARETLQGMRWAKSPTEVEILAINASSTVSALEGLMVRLEPGMRQRESESIVVSGCLSAGAQGPSFWPWTMSGPNAHTDQLFQSLSRYDLMDRTMLAGELVRVDIGCAGGFYGADVGRTLPVTGHFSAGQSEAWDLLVSGYRAGLGAMRANVPLDDVRRASVAEIRRLQPGLRTDQGKEAARVLLTRGLSVWHIHGVGIESGEEAVDPFVEGAVIAYEPTVEVGPDAFYLEDMILVTPTGHRILSSGLPYTAEEIERAMSGGP